MAQLDAGHPAETVVDNPHALPVDEVLRALASGRAGLSVEESARRLERHGRNALPSPAPRGLVATMLRQFRSPIIYILVIAAAVSALTGEWTDASFIAVVLVLNAVIGGVQEHRAERSAAALRSLVVVSVQVIRDGDPLEAPGEDLVPGDLVILEAGNRVPADVRLVDTVSLEVDESLLTGESVAVAKDAGATVPAGAPAGDRHTMAYAGTIVTRGRGTGVAVATGAETLLGQIASALQRGEATRPPLVLRMERFTRVIGLAVAGVVVLLSAVQAMQGTGWQDIFHVSVALAVAAIPEGLPVALTVALAVASSRMARRNVIVRRLVAVESLGSCTFIASDKTGTLTLNQLTVTLVALPGEEPWAVTGSATEPGGEVRIPGGTDPGRFSRFARACVLCNDGYLERREGAWVGQGDAVDVALLVMAGKAGLTRSAARQDYPEVAAIPFESVRQYAATLHRGPGGESVACVKGAIERVLEMCSAEAGPGSDRPLDRDAVLRRADDLGGRGYKVIAVADGRVDAEREFDHEALRDLTFLGLVALIDPLRPDARQSVRAAREAGLQVAMITGDHPTTALAIARELGLADSPSEVVTGRQLREAEGDTGALADRVRDARVFARVEPDQKQQIVHALTAAGHFVAVTGDGVNDAPALRAAHVGVAMGESATDVAREASDLIITDENFASVVAGIEEGRVAYANIRKVVYLLIATGAAEIVVVFLAVATGSPLPLLPVQLLWLNLVTNGIQDVALAFEPAEGDELRHSPRPPRERIFNRLMVERVLLSAAMVGLVAFGTFRVLLERGVALEAARNLVLLQMVLFENVMVGNARSEEHFVLRLNPLRNRVLFFGTLGAQALHLLAMRLPGLSDLLALQPVSLREWGVLLGLALSVFVVVETHKWLRARSMGAERTAAAGAR